MMRTFEVTDREISLRAVVVSMGDDLLVAVSGGEKPHIGSASVSVPRPSLEDPARTSSTTSTINLTGHKDNIVGDMLAAALSASLNANVVVACGIHTDSIGPEGIAHVLALSKQLTQTIIEGLNPRGGD